MDRTAKDSFKNGVPGHQDQHRRFRYPQEDERERKERTLEVDFGGGPAVVNVRLRILCLGIVNRHCFRVPAWLPDFHGRAIHRGCSGGPWQASGGRFGA